MTNQQSAASDPERTVQFPPTIQVPQGLTLSGPDFGADARMLLALGSVVRSASMADNVLRDLYCALIDSAYAAITAGGQMTDWLLTHCRALLKAKLDLPEDKKAELDGLLGEVKELANRRNRFVHDVWLTGLQSGDQLMQSRRHSHRLSLSPVDLDVLISTAQRFGRVAFDIHMWIFTNLGVEATGRGSQLRYIESQMRGSAPDPGTASELS